RRVLSRSRPEWRAALQGVGDHRRAARTNARTRMAANSLFMPALFLNWCPTNRNGFCPLRIELDRPYRIGRADEEYVVVLAAKGQIRSLFWQQNFPDQFPLRIQHVHAIHRPHVDIAFVVQTHPVGKPRGDHSQRALVAYSFAIATYVKGVDSMRVALIVGPGSLNRGAVDQ